MQDQLTIKSWTSKQYITSNLIDICAISETWIKSDADTNTIKEIAPHEYKIISQPCKSGKQGGGLALVYKGNISVKKTNDEKSSLEQWRSALLKSNLQAQQ